MKPEQPTTENTEKGTLTPLVGATPGSPPAGGANANKKPDAELPFTTVVKAPGGQTFARPVRQKKDSHVRAWILFFGIMLVLFTVWTPIQSCIAKRLAKRPIDDASRRANSFVAIAYHGVSEEGLLENSSDTSPARFNEHLAELNKRGYMPILLEDVIKFYNNEALLPEKAVLVTFEQTRKTSYFETREILRTQRFHAVMGVWGEPVDGGELQSLLWPHLRNMTIGGFWDLAAESYNGFDIIAAGPGDETSTYMSAPMWIKDQVRYETPEEFSQRINADHTNIIHKMKAGTGETPQAFFYPYGAYGQYDEAAGIIRKINLDLVRKHYKVGFTLGTLPLNTKETDPARLNRLLVNPKWTGKELADRLDMSWPETNSTSEKEYPAYAWMGDWGFLDNKEGVVNLKAVKPASPLLMNTADDTVSTAGAKAWLSGTDLFFNGYVFLRTMLKRGTFEIYLRNSSTHGNITVGITHEGNAFVRDSSGSGSDIILATDTVKEDDAAEYAILVGLKNDLVYVRVNGKLLFGGGLSLANETRAGMIGVGVWDNVKGTAEARILETKYLPLSKTIATWSPDKTAYFQSISAWLKDNSYRYTIIAPPWFEIRSGGQSSEYIKWNERAIQIMSRLNQSPVMPMVVVMDSADFRPMGAEFIAKGLIEIEADGLYLDASDCSTANLPKLAQWITDLNTTLTKEELAFAVRLPDDSLNLPSIGNLIQSHPDMIVVVPSSRNITMKFDGNFADITYAEVKEKESPLALYYRIASLLGDDRAETREDIDNIRQKGFSSFAVGEYEDAIEYWNEWREKTNRNADALALIGDAQVRLRDYPAAIASYDESLEINPGQIDVAIRYSRLLGMTGNTEARSDLLDLYATAFPETPTIVVEQARFLAENGQEENARNLLRALIVDNPEDIPARRLLHELLTDSKERYDNMREIIGLSGTTEAGVLAFGNMLWNTDMLTVPEAAIFFELIRKTSQNASGRFVRRLFESFLPRDEITDENFRYGELSDRWVAFGLPTRVGTSGQYELRAGTDMAEAYLRLKSSEFMRDGYIEVDLDESVGFFWLYARRSDTSMVRFGFDEEGMLRIQSWENGQIRSSENKSWIKPSGSITIRLEIRGQGAHGYVNGVSVFPAGISISDSLCYGWWSVAPFSSELGMARIKIRRISAGAIPSTVVVLPRISETAADDFIRDMRDAASAVSAVAPLMYVQDQRGVFNKVESRAERKIRMLCSFMRVRYMPIVDMTFFADSDMNALTSLIKREQLTSLVLWIHSRPSDAWLTKLAEVVEDTAAYICVMHVGNEEWNGDLSEDEWPKNPEFAYINVRQVERGNVLFPPMSNLWHKVTVPRLSRGKGKIERVVPLSDRKELSRMAGVSSLPELLQPRIFAYIPEGDFKVYVKGVVPPEIAMRTTNDVATATATIAATTNLVTEIPLVSTNGVVLPPSIDLITTVSNIVEKVVTDVINEKTLSGATNVTKTIETIIDGSGVSATEDDAEDDAE